MAHDYPKIAELGEFSLHDDLYICAMGFEDRSLISNKVLLKNKFKATRTLVVKYREYSEANELDKMKLESIWKNFSETVDYIEYANDEGLSGISNIRERLDSIKKDIRNITINISSLSTHLQTWIVNYAFDNFNKIRIVYTMPEKYADQNMSDNYTSGVDRIFTMRGFTGAILPGYHALLVAFLGHDVNRAKSVYEHIEPHIKIGIFPSEIDNDKSKTNIFDEHKYHFNSDDEICAHSMFDLEKILAKLSKIRKENIENANITISLCGSKLHSLYALLFAKKYKDIQLLMSMPMEYHPEQFSFGGKKTFEIIFEKKWISNFCTKYNDDYAADD